MKFSWFVFSCALLVIAVFNPCASEALGEVVPSLETEPVPSTDDAADDSCIWIHPLDPSLSLVIATDKDSGLLVYDLSGRELQHVPDGRLVNVDLRYNFPLGSQRVAIVTAGNDGDDTLAVYKLDVATRSLVPVASRGIGLGIEVYGCCMYRSPVTGEYFFIGTSRQGEVEQWRLFDDGSGKVDASLVRQLDVGEQTEGCVADDLYGWLFIAEEDFGIWKYGAEPDAGTARVMIDSTGSGGHLSADVEGLTIYYSAEGTGYLLASNQGASSFVVYERAEPHSYVKTFRVVTGNGIDGVSNTDGIDVTNFGLGAGFTCGVFVAQDDSNGTENQNFKLMAWEDVITCANPPLDIDLRWDPRRVGAAPYLFHSLPLGTASVGEMALLRVGGGATLAGGFVVLLGNLALQPTRMEILDPLFITVGFVNPAGEWHYGPQFIPGHFQDLTIYLQTLALPPAGGQILRSDVISLRID